MKLQDGDAQRLWIQWELMSPHCFLKGSFVSAKGPSCSKSSLSKCIISQPVTMLAGSCTHDVNSESHKFKESKIKLKKKKEPTPNHKKFFIDVLARSN